ncbi:baseplate assembly protein [Thermodesulfovibrio thiophilus]|uniref:baseplate assembly protein n=1 Tax=Thermodesulfovibrio thiophilus TaxID=340095 RepID=UPI000400A6C4|nr:baseplate J/gp47 family protein [Thermodesulfovibrio thiophilus]
MAIKFVETDPTLYEKQLIEAYERLTNKTLQPADPERLLINLLAYALTITSINIDETGRQNLLAYASAEHLDALAEFYGIERLYPKPATCILRFSLSSALNYDAVIPAGTRVTPDGNIIFKTVEEVKIPAGNLSAQVQAECEITGSAGNGYQVGQINKLVDVLPHDISASNTTMTMYGADIEDDERFRERIRQSIERFTNAGSCGAYIYHTLSAHQDILDVSVFSPQPGEVNVVFIMKDGESPDNSMIQLVQNYLSSEKVRPLTDMVYVSAPEVITYSINIEYYIHKKDEALAGLIQQDVEKAARDFAFWTGTKIGRDILPEELILRVKQAGAYRVIVNSPAYTALQQNQIAKADSFVLTYSGLMED